MGADIPEPDWRIFRQIHPEVLARFCGKILSEVTTLVNDTSLDSHERYLAVYKLINERNDDVARFFEGDGTAP